MLELRMSSPIVEYRPGAYAQLEVEVLAALGAGENRVVLDLDALDTLDAAGVRDLISLLRRARSIGGEVALHSSKPDVLRTLSVTALDRVFTLVKEQAA
jgi:anti-anti-sigma factor